MHVPASARHSIYTPDRHMLHPVVMEYIKDTIGLAAFLLHSEKHHNVQMPLAACCLLVCNVGGEYCAIQCHV